MVSLLSRPILLALLILFLNVNANFCLHASGIRASGESDERNQVRQPRVSDAYDPSELDALFMVGADGSVSDNDLGNDIHSITATIVLRNMEQDFPSAFAMNSPPIGDIDDEESYSDTETNGASYTENENEDEDEDTESIKVNDEIAPLIAGQNQEFNLQPSNPPLKKKLLSHGGEQYELDLYEFPKNQDKGIAWDDFKVVGTEIDRSTFIDTPSKKNYIAQLLYGGLCGVTAVSGICSLTLYYDNHFVHMPASNSVASDLSIAYIAITCAPAIIKQFTDIAGDFVRFIFKEEKFKRVRFWRGKTEGNSILFPDGATEPQDIWISQDLTPRKSMAHLACLGAHSIISALGAAIPVYTLHHIEYKEGFDIYADIVSVPLGLFFQNLLWKVGKERIDSRFISYAYIKLTEQRQKTEILLNHFSVFKKLIAQPKHASFVNNIFQLCTSLPRNQGASYFYASLLILKSAKHHTGDTFIEENAFTDLIDLNKAIEKQVHKALSDIQSDLEEGQASQKMSRETSVGELSNVDLLSDDDNSKHMLREHKESKGKEIEDEDVEESALALKKMGSYASREESEREAIERGEGKSHPKAQELRKCLRITQQVARHLQELEEERPGISESLALYSNYKVDVAHSTNSGILKNFKHWASIAVSGAASVAKYVISEHAIDFMLTSFNVDPTISFYISKVLAAGVAIWRTDTEINAVEKMISNICNLFALPNGGFKLLRVPGFWMSMINSGLVALPLTLVGDKNTFLNEIPKEVEIALLSANFFCDWSVIASCFVDQNIITPFVKKLPSRLQGWNSKVAILTAFVEELEKFIVNSTAEVREQLYRYTQDSM